MKANEEVGELSQVVDVTIVSGPDCLACEHVKERLERLRSEFPPLRVSEVDIGSSEGTALAVRYRLGGLPGILINGRMALVGDVPESLLRERLALALRAAAV